MMRGLWVLAEAAETEERTAPLEAELVPASIARPATSETLTGLVERVTFHNPDNGFCVLRVKARGQRDLVTVVGHAPVISAGEFVQATGTWINDRTHGPQFKASFLRAAPPTTVEGIEKYLGSGMIRGIGPVYGKRLVRAFGEAVFDVIEAQPDRLREVDGIGPKRAGRIIAGWADQKVIREIMIFLHSPWREHVARRADLQDLWRGCHPGPLGQPLSPRP
jgi:exodeoxyribonuclease V alpha subunit